MEAIRTERRDERVHFAGQDLTRQQPPDERAERNAAVRHGLVVARESRRARRRTNARPPEQDADRTSPPRPPPLRGPEVRASPVPEARAERVFGPDEVVSEPFVDGIVVKQDVSAPSGRTLMRGVCRGDSGARQETATRTSSPGNTSSGNSLPTIPPRMWPSAPWR